MLKGTVVLFLKVKQDMSFSFHLSQVIITVYTSMCLNKQASQWVDTWQILCFCSNRRLACFGTNQQSHN